MNVPTSIIKLKMDCRHVVETRVYYDDYSATKYDKWAGRLAYCPQCKKIQKVVRVAGGGHA